MVGEGMRSSCYLSAVSWPERAVRDPTEGKMRGEEVGLLGAGLFWWQAPARQGTDLGIFSTQAPWDSVCDPREREDPWSCLDVLLKVM